MDLNTSADNDLIVTAHKATMFLSLTYSIVVITAVTVTNIF
jgi:hypothetical protein